MRSESLSHALIKYSQKAKRQEEQQAVEQNLVLHLSLSPLKHMMMAQKSNDDSERSNGMSDVLNLAEVPFS